MYLELIAAGYILGDYAYHRLKPPPKPKPLREFQIPRSDEGSPCPLVYGRVRIKAPILAWAGGADAKETDPDGGAYNGSAPGFMYGIDMFFKLGMGFPSGTNRIHAVWAGEFALHTIPTVAFGSPLDLSTLTGKGTYERDVRMALLSTRGLTPGPSEGVWVEGEMEFLNGNGDGAGNEQRLVGDTPTFHATTLSGERMVAAGTPANQIPGYRGFMCALLTRYSPEATDPDFLADSVDAFVVGQTPTVPSFSFEVSTYPPLSITGFEGDESIGVEANPIDVIFDILVSSHGRLKIPRERVDRFVTFPAAALALDAEGHGFSRSFEEAQDAEQHISEILRQIDAVLYEDPADLKIKIRLVRGDYDPSTVLHIGPDNCERLGSFAVAGFENAINKVRVVFSDRQRSYQDNSATAMNQANAIGSDGQVREVVLQFPGVCTATLAEEIASREISALSRPVTKCSAFVDHSFWRIVPGDVVALTWPEYNVSGMLFRVGAVDRGDRENGSIRLDLVQDFFYSHRSALVVVGSHGSLGSFPVLSG